MKTGLLKTESSFIKMVFNCKFGILVHHKIKTLVSYAHENISKVMKKDHLN